MAYFKVTKGNTPPLPTRSCILVLLIMYAHHLYGWISHCYSLLKSSSESLLSQYCKSNNKQRKFKKDFPRRTFFLSAHYLYHTYNLIPVTSLKSCLFGIGGRVDIMETTAANIQW
jgi:hypothetical protein